MCLKFRTLLTLLVLQLAAGLFLPAALTAAQAAPAVPPPEGFRLEKSGEGVQLFRKDYPGGSPDYVQVVDLASGAEVKLLHGAVVEERAGKGAYEGNDARFRYQSLAGYWQSASNQTGRLFCVTSGTFFYMPEAPTRLPFPLKADGVYLTDGYASNQFEGKKLILELWPERADIQLLTKETFYSSSAPNILGGLAEDANKRALQQTGRTFAGVDDRNGDGVFETVLLISTRTATQAEAAEVLRSFGADKVMMLDGGGSAQLTCQGKALVYSERLLPQALAVLEAFPRAHDYAQVKMVEVPPAADASSLPEVAQLTPTPVSVPFSPQENRPAVILDENPVQTSQERAAPALPQPAPASVPESVPPPSQETESSILPQNNLQVEPTVNAAVLSGSSQSSLAAQTPLYQPGDVLYVPLLMAPVIVVIVIVLIRRQYLGYAYTNTH